MSTLSVTTITGTSNATVTNIVANNISVGSATINSTALVIGSSFVANATNLTTTGALSVSGTSAYTGNASFSANATVTGQVITNTIASNNALLSYKLDTSNKRQIFSAYGFDFKLDNGVLTPILGAGKSRGALGNATSTTWAVPAGVTYIYVKMWGAGGGGGTYGGWRQGSQGGAGGFSCGIVPVVPGETLTFVQGGRGAPNGGASGGYPDGGAPSTGAGDNRYAAAGGGSTRLLVPSISATVYAMIAGGGGGGGCVNGYGLNSGGAGGGYIGQNGRYSGYIVDNFGRGGTQSAGGVAGTGGNTAAGAGGYLQGGIHQNSQCYGGGGGGGYYGGSSGCYTNGNSMGGGGGGSGYIHANVILGQTHTGNGPITPFFEDPDYNLVGGTGTWNDWGMGADEGGYGGLGLVIWYY